LFACRMRYWLVPAWVMGWASAPSLAADPAGDLRLTVLAGQSTSNVWEDFFISPGSLDFVDSYLLVGALSKPLRRYFDDRLGLEVEGQVARHFGQQQHWELNLPVVARWHAFPWNSHVRTTAAFGVGPSWASRVPRLEVLHKGDSEQWLFHWFMELTLGPPDKAWDVSLRLHHRSTAWGLAGGEGGMDSLIVGVRQRF